MILTSHPTVNECKNALDKGMTKHVHHLASSLKLSIEWYIILYACIAIVYILFVASCGSHQGRYKMVINCFCNYSA